MTSVADSSRRRLVPFAGRGAVLGSGLVARGSSPYSVGPAGLPHATLKALSKLMAELGRPSWRNGEQQ